MTALDAIENPPVDTALRLCRNHIYRFQGLASMQQQRGRGEDISRIRCSMRWRVAGQRWARYLIATGASALLSLGLPLVLHQIVGLREELAVAIALALMLVINFVTIRVYVFRS